MRSQDYWPVITGKYLDLQSRRLSFLAGCPLSPVFCCRWTGIITFQILDVHSPANKYNYHLPSKLYFLLHFIDTNQPDNKYLNLVSQIKFKKTVKIYNSQLRTKTAIPGKSVNCELRKVSIRMVRCELCVSASFWRTINKKSSQAWPALMKSF